MVQQQVLQYQQIKQLDQFLVFLNGVFQRPTNDFSYSGTTLTFGTAPANADVINVKELAEGAGNVINNC